MRKQEYGPKGASKRGNGIYGTVSKPLPWKKTIWENENAFRSVSGKALAIVSEERGRLVYLGSLDGQTNLIATPSERRTPSEPNEAPDWGGHRFWLGPQKKWFWPPLPDWEHSPAQATKLQDETLSFLMPHSDRSYPQIRRSYRWTGDGRLCCKCDWQSNGTPFYGMHVIAVQPFEQLRLSLQKSSAAPEGYLRIQMDGTDSRPTSLIAAEKDAASLSAADENEGGLKIGFPLQTITISRQGLSMKMEPGEYSGEIGEEVDSAYRTQIWCRKENPFSEIEQISPYLAAPEGGWISHSVHLSLQEAQA